VIREMCSRCSEAASQAEMVNLLGEAVN
jgi:hypothetical protein